tara:strand:- start:1415 stop:1747 length:333 start_codon:yes stop_codon:yes gene_type:complete
MDLKKYNSEMTRYRIIEHQLRDKSVFVVEWNDRWLFGIWGSWHERFHCFELEEAMAKIQRLIKIKNTMGSQFFGNKNDNKTSNKNTNNKVKSKGGGKKSGAGVKKAGRGK